MLHGSYDGCCGSFRGQDSSDLTEISVASGRGEDHPNDVHSVHVFSFDVGSAVEFPISAPDPDPEVGDMRLSAGVRAALQCLDELNLVEELSRRRSVMKFPVAFLR